jgi:hypothetical protein
MFDNSLFSATAEQSHFKTLYLRAAAVDVG